MAAILADVGTIFTSAIGWVGNVITCITANPLLELFCVLPGVLRALEPDKTLTHPNAQTNQRQDTEQFKQRVSSNTSNRTTDPANSAGKDRANISKNSSHVKNSFHYILFSKQVKRA